MSDKQNISFGKKIFQSIFPTMPDFYALLMKQCDFVVAGADSLVVFMQTSNDADAKKVLDAEMQAEQVKRENIDILLRSFSTPIDREDIYRAITSLDEILNYMKSTVYEMQTLGLTSDEHTLAMATLAQKGVVALQHGFYCLKKNPLLADLDAETARKTERATEKIYRDALAELFQASHYIKTLTEDQERSAESLKILLEEQEADAASGEALAMGFIFEVLKRREVYRHMSNMADKVSQAGEILHGIVAKMT